MTHHNHCLAIATALFLLTTTVSASAERDGGRRARESVEVSNHQVFGSEQIVDGATVLIRDFKNRVVTATVTSRSLESDTAYSIWWAVFNRPEFCANPYRCALPDLKGDPRVRPSVFWAGGFLSDADGYGNTTLRLVPGRTDRELFAGGPDGLRNLKGAELHVVLRSHGPGGLAGTVAEQVGTANVACPPEECANVFVSIHGVD